jgi:predicted CopG family antitoxin
MKQLTLTVEDDIYSKLNSLAGEADVSDFVMQIIKPYLRKVELEAAYREMAQDEAREAEALEWSESLIGDIADETR